MKNSSIIQDIVKLNALRGDKTPLVHVISNYVTMNDVAQAIIFAGGRPIMAHWEEETQEITSLSSSLVINLGTLDGLRIGGIKKAAKAAREKGIPIILDPVGIQVSSKRMELARYLIEEIGVSVVKGNYSEIKTLLNLESSFIGIDSLEEEIKGEALKELKEFSRNKDMVVVLSGKEDYILFRGEGLTILNGTPLLSKITGSGCILSGILGTLCGRGEPMEEQFMLCTYGILMNSIAGEMAEERLKRGIEGLYSFKYNFMDELSLINEKDILERGIIKDV